jgi:DNA replication factor GINS
MSSRSPVSPVREEVSEDIQEVHDPEPGPPAEEPRAEEEETVLAEEQPVETGEHLEDEILVRVLEEMPPFAGPERDYVLSREDVVMLPSVIARALVTRGKAVEVTIPRARGN